MKIKIISWNMRHTLDAWEYLKKELKPDIALLQEAPKYPDGLFNNIIHDVIGQFGKKNYKWGNAIVSDSIPLTPIKIATKYKGCLQVAKAEYSTDNYFSLINNICNTFAGYFKIEISIFTLHESTKLFFKEYRE